MTNLCQVGRTVCRVACASGSYQRTPDSSYKTPHTTTIGVRPSTRLTDKSQSPIRRFRIRSWAHSQPLSRLLGRPDSKSLRGGGRVRSGNGLPERSMDRDMLDYWLPLRFVRALRYPGCASSMTRAEPRVLGCLFVTRTMENCLSSMTLLDRAP